MPVDVLKKLRSGEVAKVSDGWPLKTSFFDPLDDPVPLDVMERINVPVFVVHGDGDQVVLIEASKKGYEIIKDLNERNELYAVKGGDHTFSEREHTLEVIEKTCELLLSLQL